jgi:hypothetical protein
VLVVLHSVIVVISEIIKLCRCGVTNVVVQSLSVCRGNRIRILGLKYVYVVVEITFSINKKNNHRQMNAILISFMICSVIM